MVRKMGIKWMPRRTETSDAVTVISALLLCLIKSYFDIWNSASRATLTTLKKSIIGSATQQDLIYDVLLPWGLSGISAPHVSMF